MRLALALLAASTAMSAVFAQAPAQQLSPRVDRLEKEMRAVQRKVFPGAAPQYFDAEVQPAQAAPTAAGTPSGSALADLTARIDTLEKELARLTGQVEQAGFRARQADENAAKMRTELDARLKVLEAAAAPAMLPPAGQPLPAPSATRPGRTPPGRPLPNLDAPTASAPPPAAPPVAATAAVPTPVPSTGDAGEDAYMAAYRLWEGKKFGEAQAALKQVVAKYPNHKRASYAQNLLGRAYLDDGKPAMAAEAFYANYQKMPRGERAPDSLYFLGQSLVALKPAKTAEACKVYDELNDVYGATIKEPLKGRVAKARTDAKCS